MNKILFVMVGAVILSQSVVYAADQSETRLASNYCETTNCWQHNPCAMHGAIVSAHFLNKNYTTIKSCETNPTSAQISSYHPFDDGGCSFASGEFRVEKGTVVQGPVGCASRLCKDNIPNLANLLSLNRKQMEALQTRHGKTLVPDGTVCAALLPHENAGAQRLWTVVPVVGKKGTTKFAVQASVVKYSEDK